MAKQRSLLLVDDDAATLRVLSKVLGTYPDQRLAISGEQALSLAHTRCPDLMLIDMEMPGMSGTQLCSLVKNDSLLAHVPVLFVTSDESEATRLEALQLGAADFVTKPIVAEQLQARVAAVLRTVAEVERAKAEATHAAMHEPEVLRAGPARLLVVGSDPQEVAALHETLEGIGEVRTADPRDLVMIMVLVRSWRPDLVLVDSSPTGKDEQGFDLCRLLKAAPGLNHVPIVFVSRQADSFDESRALALGAADIIARPFSSAVLKARVRNLLELKRRTDIELAMAASQGQRLQADRLAAVVEGASDGIITINAAGDIALMNAAAGRLLDMDPLTATGRPASDVLTERLHGLDLTLPTSGQRVLITRPDLTRIPAEVSISTVGDGSLRLTTLMCRDLTDRERLTAESSARTAAEAANKTKALMISYVAHEIGNPLNCILGFAQLLASDRSSPLTPGQAQRVAMIEAGCTQLSTLMNDLSALGHFELGQLSVQRGPVDVKGTLDSALQTTAGLAEQMGISLTHDDQMPPGLLALGDGNRLRQCLVNLLSNGIKYNKRRGRVSVTLRVLNDHLEISIADTGIGMTEEQISHLFEPFNRLGLQGSHLPGTGLGLVVTRQLIDAMGGRLIVTSTPNEGSCFTLELQLAEAVQPL
jgi:signal transduction histidine kinase/ActR/RegA family two-component response regulator